MDKHEEEAVEKELMEGVKDAKLYPESINPDLGLNPIDPTTILLTIIYTLVKPGQGVVFTQNDKKYVALVNDDRGILVHEAKNILQDLDTVPDGLINYVEDEEATVESSIS